MSLNEKPDLRLLWYSACAAAARHIAADAFDITVDVMLSPRRGKQHIALARQVAMYMTHTICSVPLTHVATAFRRDRTTASHACQRVEDMRDDSYFNSQLEALEHRLVSEMRRLEGDQLSRQQAVIDREAKAVVGGAPDGQLLISSENGRLLEFKYLKR